METTHYPVDIEVTPPPRYERMQLLLRVAILIALGIAGVSMGWAFGLLYLFLPIIAAVGISSQGPTGYLEKSETLRRVLSWFVSLQAYMLLVIDRFPVGAEAPGVHMTIEPGGTPTATTALLRWFSSIPSALLLMVFGIVSGVLCFVGALFILFTETQPAGIVRFQIAMVRWLARLLGYHASLVEPYPPFTLDVGEHHEPLATGG
jgi:hypothetical protein